MPKPTSTPRKDKVMVYLPSGLRRSMSVLAAERGCRISDLYAEAVSEYLRSPRRPAPETPAASEQVPALPGARDDPLQRILRLLDGQGRMLLDIQASAASMVPEVETRALAVVIAAVFRAGRNGLSTPDVRARLDAEGFVGLKTTTVRDALVRAGVVRHRDGRWSRRDTVS